MMRATNEPGQRRVATTQEDKRPGFASPPDRVWAPALRGHLPALDGLRGIAILLVIVSHYLGNYYTAATVGWTGVNLFFVLSGFLITGILLDTKGSQRYFRNFYARRFLRIFPAYYLALFLLFVVAPRFPSLVTEGYREAFGAQGWLWTYTGNIRSSFFAEIGGPTPFNAGWVRTLHFWSLAVEEQFYLVWPAVVLGLTRRQLLAVCVGCFVGAAALRWGFTAAENLTAPYFFTLCRMDDLAAGGFIACVLRAPDGLDRLRACAPWVSILALWILVGVWHDVGHFFQLTPDVQRYAYSAIALLYASLVVFALAPASWTPYRWLLEMRWLRSVGKYSYAIYIVHWGLAELVFFRLVPLEGYTPGTPEFLRRALLQTAVVTVGSYGIAFASWHLYEKHFLRLKTRFYA